MEIGFCIRSLFCYAILCVISSFAIITLGKRGLVALLLLSSGYHVAVIAIILFLMVPWVGLWYVHGNRVISWSYLLAFSYVVYVYLTLTLNNCQAQIRGGGGGADFF